MKNLGREETIQILKNYSVQETQKTADKLRDLWLQFEPKSIEVIKAEQRKIQETVGIPVDVLKTIGKEIGKAACKDVNLYLPLVELLWQQYGREGRVVAVYPLGAMVLVQPQRLVDVIKTLCRTCITWEDADQLAMYALEPIVRKNPQIWFAELENWIKDENKWLRRGGITVAGRLAMKKAEYVPQVLHMAEGMLLDEEQDVKRAVSFAVRLSVRGQVQPVVDFLKAQIPAQDPAAIWVLCDIVRSMAAQFLPAFTGLLPQFESWAESPDLSAAERRSIESAVKILRKSL